MCDECLCFDFVSFESKYIEVDHYKGLNPELVIFHKMADFGSD